jgi:hypothetical protein
MLNMVVRTESARPELFEGDDVIGAERFWHIRGRNCSRFGDWRTRWTSRL